MGIVRDLVEKRTQLEWRFYTREKALVPSAMAQAFLGLTSAAMGNGTMRGSKISRCRSPPPLQSVASQSSRLLSRVHGRG